MPPILTGVYETVLYVTDLEATGRFYAGVLGLRTIRENAPLLDGFRLPGGGVLLLFIAGESIKPGRGVPSHGTTGPGHVALSMRAGDWATWLEYLRSTGVPVEHEQDWPVGGRSLYIRDPDNNSVELVEGEVWPV